MSDEPSAAVTIRYTDDAGVMSRRRVVPMWVKFTSNRWYPEPQWLMEAVDLDRGEIRSFAMKNVRSWKPAGDDR